jgi:hypothetical protein
MARERNCGRAERDWAVLLVSVKRRVLGRFLVQGLLAAKSISVEDFACKG